MYISEQETYPKNVSVDSEKARGAIDIILFSHQDSFMRNAKITM